MNSTTYKIIVEQHEEGRARGVGPHGSLLPSR